MAVVYTVLLLAASIPLLSGENCEPLTVKSCSSAGYRLTARFPDVDGTPYQDVQAPGLNLYVPLLSYCSDFASTILCSLYLPKCEEGRDTPVPPCRKVCRQFVTECEGSLRKAALAGMFTVLCDLLPDGDGQPKECFYPSNFKDTTPGGNAICLPSTVNKLCNYFKKIIHNFSGHALLKLWNSFHSASSNQRHRYTLKKQPHVKSFDMKNFKFSLNCLVDFSTSYMLLLNQ